jgi:hypothetical protein
VVYHPLPPMNDLEHYELAYELSRQPSEATARKLITMLGAKELLTIQEGCSPYDVDPVYGRVSEVARGSLVSMPTFAVPAIVEALPSATVESTKELWSILNQAPVDLRIALSDEAHAVIERAAQRLDPIDAEHARFERDFARRVRANELPEPEARWRAWLAHPTRASAAIPKLAEVVKDRAAFARELVAWLDDPIIGKSGTTLVYKLKDFARLLPPETVRALAASEHPRKHEDLVPLLAAFGEPAAPLIPLCIEMLRNEPLGDDERMVSRHMRWHRATEALVDLVDEIESPHLEMLYALIDEMAAEPGVYQQCGVELYKALDRPTWEK